MSARLSSVKVTLVVLLVLLIFVGALAIGMGGPTMEWCPECVFPGGTAVGMMCVAILGLFVLVVPGASSILARRAITFPPLLFASSRDRPPRFA